MFPQVQVLDLAGSVQAFYEATQFGNIDYKLIFAYGSESLRSEQGLLFADLQHPDKISLQEGDFVIIPGFDFASFRKGALDADISKYKTWLQDQHKSGVRMASVCTGALVLGEAGLLDEHRCTCHWKCIEYMVEQYPKAKVEVDRLFVEDGTIMTSAGMTSGIDMSLSIIEQEQGPIVSAQVAREMVVYMRRQGSSSQSTIYLDYHTHFNPLVHKVQNYIISNPSENASLEKLAEVGNTSVRNLTRSFRRATGHTISDFKLDIKSELAGHLINNPSYTIENIAEMCGFKSARHLQRIWKKKFGTSISEDRRGLN